MAEKNKSVAESALHYGLKKNVRVVFIDNTSITGQLDFVNRYEYVLKDVSRKVKSNGEIKDDKFDHEVVVLKASVKYLTVVE